MGIVQEIVEAIKPIIITETGFTQLRYEFNPELNTDRDFTERFGFIPGTGAFVAGRVIGSTTIDHTFTIILTDDYSNKDNDEAQSAALYNLYEKTENLLKVLQKSKLSLPSASYRLNLISGLDYEDPQYLEGNTGVILRASVNINYSYKNI